MEKIIKCFVGIDIERINAKIGILNEEGKILKTESIKAKLQKDPEETTKRGYGKQQKNDSLKFLNQAA